MQVAKLSKTVGVQSDEISPVVSLTSMLDFPLAGGPTTTHLIGTGSAMALSLT